MERGRPWHDALHEFLMERIQGRWLDVGCNTGWLLQDVANGVGIEPTWLLVRRAREKGLNVVYGWGEYLPFADGVFDTVVLASVLEQCLEPYRVVREAIRVGGKVIGCNSTPEGPWGLNSSSPWVKAVLYPAEFAETWGARVEPYDDIAYYFEVG